MEPENERMAIMKEYEALQSPHVNRESFLEGRRTGLAIGALAASAVAFISLLGIEKALLAIVLAILAMRGAAPSTPARRLAWGSLGVALLYVLTFVAVMALFHERLGELVRLLQQMA
jgi:ABC-type multidrug transport system fused ATPase/permease subunit